MCCLYPALKTSRSSIANKIKPNYPVPRSDKMLQVVTTWGLSSLPKPHYVFALMPCVPATVNLLFPEDALPFVSSGMGGDRQTEEKKVQHISVLSFFLPS